MVVEHFFIVIRWKICQNGASRLELLNWIFILFSVGMWKAESSARMKIGLGGEGIDKVDVDWTGSLMESSKTKLWWI